MAEFVKGDVVVIPFPFSDLSEAKRRPAFVVTKLTGDDLVLCQITSHTIKDKYAVSLNVSDFVQGNLSTNSNIRPNRIFTADKNIILYKVGSVKIEKIKEVIESIVKMIQN